VFRELEKINQRPKPFEVYTAAELWTDKHRSEQMLAYHLNSDIDVASRRSAFIDRSVAWISSEFNVVSATRIADFGCGPGLYAAKLAGRGARVTGIDFSKNSIKYARTIAAGEQLSIQYVHQNYLDFETEDRFDLILMIMCDFCALSPTQRHEMLKKFHRLLQAGGAILLDVYSLSAFEQREEAAFYERNQLNGFWSSEEYFGFLNTFKYEQEKVTLDKYTIIEIEKTSVIYNWLQYFSPESLQKELGEAGFAVSSSYADVAGAPFDETASEFAVVARKKS
jgi:SAM-dependent methyltransferase